MTKLTIAEKQEILLEVLSEKQGTGEAIFGIEKEVAEPLVKAGILHKDTYRYTGGCILDRKTMQEVTGLTAEQAGKITLQVIIEELKKVNL